MTLAEAVMARVGGFLCGVGIGAILGAHIGLWGIPLTVLLVTHTHLTASYYAQRAAR